jgi:DNA polymerase bacteriophage-type
MQRLYFDTETYSEVNLTTSGSYVYARDCEVMVVSYALEWGPVQVWDRTADPRMPADLFEWLMDEEILVVAHNSMFDRHVSKHSLGIDLPPERWFDTMVQAYVHSLPGRLDLLSKIFKLDEDEAKQGDRGRELIHLFCKPRPKNHKLRRATRETHPTEWQEFLDYAGSDIRSMRRLHHMMPRWNCKITRQDWLLDQRINDRGVQIDVELCHAAQREAEKGKRALQVEIQDATLGVLTSATQRDRFIKFLLEAYDVPLPDLTADTIERRLSDPELPEPVKELLRIRAQASLASVAKFKRAASYVNTDGRLRGAIAFSGAQRTGRRAGRGVQPQNMPRTAKRFAKVIEDVVQATKSGALDLCYDSPMEALRAVTRGIFVAAPGRKLTVVDWANIEGRGLAWSAGENWKLDAFRAYDAKTGPDLYNVAYARSFNVRVESVNKDQRQIGKVQELALGYGGGVGAFVAMALVYRMDLEELSAAVLKVAKSEDRIQSEYAYEWAVQKNRTLGLPRHIFVACHILRTLWRAAHPNVVQWWKDLEDGFRAAILSPEGTKHKAGPVTFDRVKKWVRMQLPSGRYLCYAGAHISDKGDLRYRGINQYTRQWSWQKTHGGKIAENAVQAICGDILSIGIQIAEDNGYPMVLSVHDELATEPLDLPEFNHWNLSKLVSVPIPWAPGFPIAAAGYDAYRYRKE